MQEGNGGQQNQWQKSIAAGCDGLMIEVHNNPEKALCDGPQSLRPEKYEELLKQINKIADVVGKKVQKM